MGCGHRIEWPRKGRAALGKLSEAQRLQHKCLAIRQALGDRRGLPLSIPSLAEIALDQRNFALADAHYSDGLASAARIGDRRAMVQALEGFALLAAANGEPERTLILAAATDSLRRELGSSLTTERKRLQVPLVLARRALGEPASRVASAIGRGLGLEAAMSFALRRDTASHLQPLDQILNQALAPESGQVKRQYGLADGVRAGLTPRQAEVLRLVAQGKTDRQIAAELVLSEKTVGRHLENIFTRLGVSSRSAATVVAAHYELV